MTVAWSIEVDARRRRYQEFNGSENLQSEARFQAHVRAERGQAEAQGCERRIALRHSKTRCQSFAL